jgi:hypothetical protein
MTCFNGHSSSIYNFAINAFFFSHTSDEIEVFILRGQKLTVQGKGLGEGKGRKEELRIRIRRRSMISESQKKKIKKKKRQETGERGI